MLSKSLRHAIDAAAVLTLQAPCTAWSRLGAAYFRFMAGVTGCPVSQYLSSRLILHVRSVRHGPDGMDIPPELRCCSER